MNRNTQFKIYVWSPENVITLHDLISYWTGDLVEVVESAGRLQPGIMGNLGHLNKEILRIIGINKIKSFMLTWHQ
jgi:hypothetical protein